MIFMDFRRPSTYEDFSYIPNYEKDLTYEIVSGFLEIKDDCDWSMKYIEGDFKKLRVCRLNHEALISTISEILISVGYQGSIQDINYDNFKYLSQQ
jgi:hypothetical protein